MMSSTIVTEGRPADHHDECRIRIAAAGDIHYGERADDRARAAEALRGRWTSAPTSCSWPAT